MTKFDKLRNEIDKLEEADRIKQANVANDKKIMLERIMDMKYREFNKFCIAHGSGNVHIDPTSIIECDFANLEAKVLASVGEKLKQTPKHYGQHVDCDFCRHYGPGPHKSVVGDTSDGRIGKYCKLWNCRDNKAVKGTPIKVLRQWQFNEYKIIGFIDDTGCRWDKAERVYK